MQYALIAGGSKGIGFAIASALAKRGYNLILIARNLDKLEEAKRSLEKQYNISVLILSKDLSKPSTAGEIKGFCESNDLPIQMLCNVAGMGGADDYLTLPLSQSRYMIHLNLESMMALTDEILPFLENNGPAFILNVGSMAGLAPIPEKNIYSATKSAVIFFSRALRYQLKSKNISVSCLCPGPVFTKPEIHKETVEKLGWLGMQMELAPGKVGEIAVRQTLNKKFMIIPGIVCKIISFFVRLFPEALLVFIYGKLGKRSKN